jgi:hypothetical protein
MFAFSIVGAPAVRLILLSNLLGGSARRKSRGAKPEHAGQPGS